MVIRAAKAQGKFMHTAQMIVFISTLLFLGGCTENPLIGTWKAKPRQGNALIMCPEIKFTKNISICGGIVEDVSYDVEDGMVIVSSELGNIFGMKSAYDIADRNTMTISMPFGGKIVYNRSSY
jgi:hypothetical protein